MFGCDGRKKHCPSLTSLPNGKIINISESIQKYVCNRGYKMTVKASRFRRCNHDTGQWSPPHYPRCIDKNECDTKRKPCHKHARCYNSVGSYRCVCRPGYKGNGKECIEPEFINNKSCGIIKKTRNKTRRRVRRIVGGTASGPGDWPWVAHITIKGEIFSGVLIKPNWIITTANSLFKQNGIHQPDEIMVALGEYDRNKPENEEQYFRVANIHIHPKFKLKDGLSNDIALLELDGSAVMTDYVNTICLTTFRTTRKFEKNYRTATITGWGQTKPQSLTQLLQPQKTNQLYSGVLQEVQIPLIPFYKCGKSTTYRFHRKTMLCAGSDITDLVNAPCVGDLGSPLVIKDPETKRWILLGIFSWSEGCGQPRKYSYYTRISRYIEWINSITTGLKGNEL